MQAKAMCHRGLPTKEVAKLFGVTSETITCRLREDFGAPVSRLPHRKYKVNHEAFDAGKWSPEASYWLGLLHSDGSVIKNYVTLGLKATDGYLIEGFKNFCGYEGLVKVRAAKVDKRGYSCSEFHYIRIGSTLLASRLKELGIRTNNKMIVDVPGWNDCYLRGMFDGNGSISIGKKGQVKWMMCGRLETVQFFKDSALLLNPSIRITGPRRDRNIFKIYISSRSSCSAMCGILYGGGGPRMLRKEARMLSLQ